MRGLIFLAFSVLFAALFIASEPVRAGFLTRALSLNGAPQVVSYQGQMSVDGKAYTGSGYFKFAVVNASGATTYWSNDGTASGEPAAAVSIPVSKGLFNVLLGDTSLTHMQALPAGAFSDPARSLRVWFSSDNATFTQLSPDRRFAAAPYALQAEEAKTAASAQDATNLDALPASAFQQRTANTLIVAKSGGDFTTLTAALDSITDASSTNPYRIQVMPGVYSEQVVMKSYVDIEGSAESVTRITQPGFASSTAGTVIGAANAELRSLTVENSGGAANAIAIYHAPSLSFVTVRATGGTYAVGVEVNAPAADQPRIRNVTITVSGATNSNTGVRGGSLTLQDVTITVSGGQHSYGTYTAISSPQPSLTLSGVTINASGGTVESLGMFSAYAKDITLFDCTISASGTPSYGIFSEGLDASPYTLGITRSRISGDNYSVMNFKGTTRVIDGQLGGGPANNISGTLTCAGVHDENYVFSTNTCP